MTPAFDTVAWFQIGTPDSAAAQRFYGELFGWSFQQDPGSGENYQLVTAREAAGPGGGLSQEEAGTSYAVFCVLVRDVDAACARAAELGGKVLNQPVATENGLVFADLLDGDGNRFMVFSPPPQ